MKTETCIRIRPSLKIFKGYPNLVPFISVFFILTIFFMLANNFVPVQGFRVELPRANAEIRYAARVLVVTVDKKGALYFNDEPADSPEMLKRRIAECLSNHEGVTDLIVRTDVSTDMNTTVRILEIARDLNLSPYFMVDRSRTENTNFADPEQ